MSRTMSAGWFVDTEEVVDVVELDKELEGLKCSGPENCMRQWESNSESSSLSPTSSTTCSVFMSRDGLLVVVDVDVVEDGACEEEDEHPSTGSAQIPCRAPLRRAGSRLQIQVGNKGSAGAGVVEPPPDDDEALGLRDLSRVI